MNVDTSKEKVKKLYDFWRNLSKRDQTELDYIFDRVQNKPDLSDRNLSLVNEIRNRIKKIYPSRSDITKLGISGGELNKKFCKDGYMYVLRGDYRNCEGGFYTLQYSCSGKNLEQLSSELSPAEAQYMLTHSDTSFEDENIPQNTAEVFLNRQTQSGGAPFISATTNFQIAEEFASSKDGEIYILRVKMSDIIKAVNDLGMDEVEYLIPDFVEMSEVAEKFSYKDYTKIKEYLTEVVRFRTR